MNTFCSCVLFLFILRLFSVRSDAPINCVWASWSLWSPCNPCTKTQTQIRSVAVYPQFGGYSCSGPSLRTQNCETTQGCPLEEGCGSRFRCQSGQCVSQSLVCNGDQDCQDGSDEWRCESQHVCNLQIPPPKIEASGRGYDAVKKEFRESVINTQVFGGQCRKIFSGDHQNYYRLPQSTLGYSFQVTAKSDFSSEFYESVWHWVQKIENRERTTGTTSGHRDYTSNEELKKIQSKQLVEVSSDVEVAQVQNQPPQYLPISEEFWRALSSLPVVYDYAAYRQLLERFGTHYVSEGTLGGRFRALLYFSRDFIESKKHEVWDFHECVKETHTVFFFITWTTEKCKSYFDEVKNGFQSDSLKNLKRVNTMGGDTGYIAVLNTLDVNRAAENLNAFSKWAGSVKNFPVLINFKTQPVYGLVKEVSCSEVKKLYLKRATEAYLRERDSCHCSPCKNNGLVVLKDGVCACVCKLGTEGSACESGAPVNEQAGVIDGGWSCWSEWSSCSAGRRSRTRSCTRPEPRNGKQCVGNGEEPSICEEEQELEYLRTIQPHCFDQSLEKKKSCKNPPALHNGFVLDPRDFYIIGNRIEYSCIDGYHLVGDPIAECTEDETWRKSTMECKRTTCDPPALSLGVSPSLWKTSYKIGESVMLKCADGRERIGPEEILCNAGLSWSPEPKNTKCATVVTEPPTRLQCEPWENKAENKCVCKVPYQCEPSLEVCVNNKVRSLFSRQSVCKARALQCLGHQLTVAEHSACQWPGSDPAVCPQCSLWTTCDEQTNMCHCKTLDECVASSRWINICVRVTKDSEVSTVTECEVGVRRCKGETPQIIKLQACEV
ncbi:complement component C7 isoform X1 [Clarias gariepinus]|uniref:complement component C7 isoform X1 n=1 Tax=Clarias gariepinus TaxID=13013 RepID=UPI00234D95C0|nr:complement component C7 isoform X1 [Clarias gariepinus]XP_053359880.1 complement component C7 isoform X1 [Clarias gariepinus]